MKKYNDIILKSILVIVQRWPGTPRFNINQLHSPANKDDITKVA